MTEVEYLRQENLKLRQQLDWHKLDVETRDSIQSILEEKQNEDATKSGPMHYRHVDRTYFSSYSSAHIHREMLEDKV